MHSSHDLLVNVWNQLEKIPFNTKWRNDTGYYDGAADEEVKSAVAFQDEAPNSRIGIILPINGHVIVLFERYTPEEGVKNVVVSNSSKQDIVSGAIELQTLIALLALCGLRYQY